MTNNQLLINVNDTLYGLVFERLCNCKPSSNSIIRFPVVFQKLGSTLSLPKKQVWKLLFVLRDLGFIEIVACHGIKINEQRKGSERNGKK